MPARKPALSHPLTVDVFRAAFLQGPPFGLSTKYDSLKLYPSREAWQADPNRELVGETAIISMSKPSGYGDTYHYAVPAIKQEGSGPMMGGAYVGICDSRFAEVYGSLIPLHDRLE